MAQTRPIEPVVRMCALFSRHAEALHWARQRLTERWGSIVVSTPEFPFEPGDFYTPTMGRGLLKQLIAFNDVVDPEGLAAWKQETNQWEAEFTGSTSNLETRPLNLDPGYVTQAKLVLATTKDRDHRIYLRDGMFAEVTLSYTGGAWVHHRWTYPDYRTDTAAEFVSACREHLRRILRESGQWRRVVPPGSGH